MTGKKDEEGLEKIKKEYLDRCCKHFDEVFSKDTFNLTFDEREKLIFGKFKEESREMLEKQIAQDPQSAKKNTTPAESVLCHCGTEANLVKDEDGNPKIYKRQVTTKTGPIKIQEYGYYCSKDRKVFFPSAKNT